MVKTRPLHRVTRPGMGVWFLPFRFARTGNLAPSSYAQNQNAAKQDRPTTLSIYTKPILPVFGFHAGTRSNLSNSAAVWMSCC